MQKVYILISSILRNTIFHPFFIEHFLGTIFEEIGGIKEAECSSLIAADLSTNGGIVSYPSTLGETIDSQMTKQRLTLFLVSL